ncbi:MAG: site-2 protease family protein [Candidatus Zixiibacteriota bacterium]
MAGKWDVQWTQSSSEADAPFLTESYFADHSPPPVKKSNPYINLALFIITFITTTLAGALMQGEFEFSLRYFLTGFEFSLPLLLILGVHEMGHYLMSRYHGVAATLPYFIPGPTIIGTFGALIKIKSPISYRKALFDIGFAGPFAGFVVALPLLFIGFARSNIMPVTALAETEIIFGDSILTYLVQRIMYGAMPENITLMLSPMGFAAWIGLWITSINLLPLGQLDGGHIAYSVFGPKWNKYSKIVFAVMLLLGIFWYGWLFWGLIIFFIIKLRHPRTRDDNMPLTGWRKYGAILALIIFALTFIPVPFKI